MPKVIHTAIKRNNISYIEKIEEQKSTNILGHQISHFFHQKVPDITAKENSPTENFDLNLGGVRCIRSTLLPTKETYNKIKPDQQPPLEEYFLHNTNTMDFVIVLEGIITMIVGNEAIELHPQDVVIQKGAMHAWHNYTDQQASFFAVMIGAKTPDNFQSHEAIFPEIIN